MYRKADFDRLGGFDQNLRVYEDWERWLRAIANHQKGWTIPEYLDCYRRTDSGLHGTSLQNSLQSHQEVETIRSRYQKVFAKHSFPDIKLVNSSFAALQLTLPITEKNTLSISANRRILCFFPFLEVGGADRFNLDLLTLLAQQNTHITIATTVASHHPWYQHFYRLTPDIFHLSNLLQPQQWLRLTKYLIQSRSVDIVFISNCYIAYYFLPLLTGELPDVTFVDLTHTTDPGWRGSGYPRVSCQFSAFLDAQIVTSQNLADYYRREQAAGSRQQVDEREQVGGMPYLDISERLKVCYTCIDTEKWVRDEQKRQTLRSQLNIAENTVVLLFPARLVEQKRPLFLVDLAKELASHHQSFLVIVLGTGELKAAMEWKIEQLNVNKYFRLLPPTPPSAMLGFYSAADILLLPSAYEGLSLAIYEAMSMQLPIVAADVGGQRELVTAETGTLLPKGEGNEREVQKYLQALLPLLKEPQLRQQQGKRARQRVVKLFGRDRLAESINTIFDEAITSHQNYPKPRVNANMTEELLLIALEYHTQEETLSTLWQQKCQLEAERHELAWQKKAMESSKFWQLRKLWFKFKRRLKLTEEEEIE